MSRSASSSAPPGPGAIRAVSSTAAKRPAGERAHVGDRHHADDLAARRLGDVDVVAQIGQRATIETLDARLAAAGDQPMETLEVVTPAAPHPEAALEHPSRRHPARGL